MADNVYLCLKCGEYFGTKVELKTHTCERVISRDRKVIKGKEFPNVDPNKVERRELGERLKALGEIDKRSKINFTDIEELREWVSRAEDKLESSKNSEE